MSEANRREQPRTNESVVHVLQVASALDRKERLLTQLRTMNDEAERCGPDGRKAQTSDQFRQAYAQVVMQLKQVRTAAPPPPPLSLPPSFLPFCPLSLALSGPCPSWRAALALRTAPLSPTASPPSWQTSGCMSPCQSFIL